MGRMVNRTGRLSHNDGGQTRKPTRRHAVQRLWRSTSQRCRRWPHLQV